MIQFLRLLKWFSIAQKTFTVSSRCGTRCLTCVRDYLTLLAVTLPSLNAMGPSSVHPSPDPSASGRDIVSMIEGLRYLIEGRLAFLSASPWQIDDIKSIYDMDTVCFISSDLHRKYFPLAADFGPVCLGIVHRFCSGFDKRVRADDSRLIVYCISDCFEDTANASFLLASYMMLCQGRTAEDAAEPFTCHTAPFTLRPFRDASVLETDYPLSLLDCLKGLSKAVAHGWFSIESFDAQNYWDLDDTQSGDLHEICPKFVAMKGPLSRGSRHRVPLEISFTAKEYISTLHRLGVSCIVRLNEPDTYDKDDFERAGIAHHDLYFDDCTAPPDAVVERFLDICDREGRVAVHCRAGLGRTGTLIGLWLMKHAGFGADEAIGWLRIVRPGSVIGPQQHYMKAAEGRGWRGNALLPAALSAPHQPSAAATATTTAEELAAQVTVGMCARAAARAAAAAGPSRRPGSSFCRPHRMAALPA